MKTPSLTILAVFAAGLVTLIAGSARADDAALPEEVDHILKDMATFLENLDRFTFKAEVLYDEVLASGQSIQHGADLKTAVQRPNRLAARFEGDRGMRTLWYDGKAVTVLHNNQGVYSNAPIKAKTVGTALDQLMKKHQFSMPLADFVSNDVYGSLTTEVDEASYVGKAMVNGKSCDHIACRQGLIDWQLWVEDGIRRLPRKIVITYKATPGTPVYMAQFSSWDLNATLPDLLFQPNLPPAATMIELLEVE